MICTSKINFYSDNLKDNETYKTSRRGAVATRIASLFLAAAISLGVSNFVKVEPANNGDISLRPAYTVLTTSDEINDMNIIINDGDCGNAFFSEVVQTLQDDGLKVTTTSNFQNINQDNSVVITLDQQYSAGPGTVILAPFNNTRVGYSDSLAICMQSAFNQNGFLADEISCGQIGYEKDENGNVSYMVPSSTERAIDVDKDTSFVTISFGTSSTNSSLVAKSIENGLSRYHHFLQGAHTESDLIYRASESDSLDAVADYFGTSTDKLKDANNIGQENLTDSQTVINPSVKEMGVFDSKSEFYLDGNETKKY